ncbi:MAG: DNA primase [Desulfovibrio sp.]|jgi:DNA primase|nr:DNA primase [Desulfovibrio sp.]
MKTGDTVRLVKERLNIVDMVRRYVELKRNGTRWVAPCPFHPETKPSFSVNEELGVFYCFGCQASGDIFTFYSRINGLDFKETLEQLALEAGVSPGRSPVANDRRHEEKSDTHRSARQQMLRMHQIAAAHFTTELKGNGGAECRDYIKRRGLNDEIAEHFGLGWAGREWDSLTKRLRRAGFSEQVAVGANLLSKSAKGAVYDRFRGRLVFPIKNLAGQVIAFGGRIIRDEDEAKYINSADTPIYKKGEHIFGLPQARKNITSVGTALLTEGYMDVVTLHQFGYGNAVGVLGTALTPEQVKRISGFTSRVTMLFDGDRAGRKAALRGCEMLLARGLDCSVVVFPDGEDIDSFLRKEGTGAFDELLRNAVDGLKYCITLLKSRAPREAVEWARNFLRSVEIPELLSPYLSKLAGNLQLSENVLRENLADWHGQNQSKHRTLPPNTHEKKPSRQNMRDRQILMFAVRYPARLHDLRAMGADMLLQSAIAKKTWKNLAEWGEDAHHHLEDAEKNFWLLCRGPHAPPRDNGDRELELLRNQLDAYYDCAQKSSVFVALSSNTSTGDFDSDLDYLRALQKTLEKKHE